MSQRVAAWCSVMQRDAVSCSMLQRVEVCCSVLRLGVAVRACVFAVTRSRRAKVIDDG